MIVTLPNKNSVCALLQRLWKAELPAITFRNRWFDDVFLEHERPSSVR